MKTSNIEHRTSNAQWIGLAAIGFVLLAALVLMPGCATIAAGNDPIVVRSEQSITTAQATIDTFLKLDNADRELVRRKAPEAHAFAEWLRVQVPLTAGSPVIVARWAALVYSADQVKNAYKAHRTLENRANLMTALATLETTLNQVQLDMAEVNSVNP